MICWRWEEVNPSIPDKAESRPREIGSRFDPLISSRLGSAVEARNIARGSKYKYSALRVQGITHSHRNLNYLIRGRTEHRRACVYARVAKQDDDQDAVDKNAESPFDEVTKNKIRARAWAKVRGTVYLNKSAGRHGCGVWAYGSTSSRAEKIFVRQAQGVRGGEGMDTYGRGACGWQARSRSAICKIR